MPVFCVWLLPFNMKFLRFIHVVICISSSFFFCKSFLKTIFLFWNNYKFIETCKNSAEKSMYSSPVFSNGYILHKKRSIFLQYIL